MTFTQAVVRFVRWLREGYPEWAPRYGYVPLIALNGRDAAPDGAAMLAIARCSPTRSEGLLPALRKPQPTFHVAHGRS